MPITPDEFRGKLAVLVQKHYETQNAPLLLARLGTELDQMDAWPVERGQRSLKQLIAEYASPDVELIWDKRSPSYIAVSTPDLRDRVRTQVEERLGARSHSVQLEELVKPVLLAFCIDTHDRSIFLRRFRPFRYEVGQIPEDQASEFVLVEPEFRRPGLRVERLQGIAPTDRTDLANRIQKWAIVHEVSVEQFYRREQEPNQPSSEMLTSALDRLLNAQTPDVAQRMMIPADIAQVLSRIR